MSEGDCYRFDADGSRALVRARGLRLGDRFVWKDDASNGAYAPGTVFVVTVPPYLSGSGEDEEWVMMAREESAPPPLGLVVPAAPLGGDWFADLMRANAEIDALLGPATA